MEISLTLVIVILTCLVSVPALSSAKMKEDLIFYPPAVTYQKQWYRFITSGFIHDDFMHLAFNMLALYSFGRFVESGFILMFGEGKGKLLYAFMYLLALIVSLLPTYLKHKENSRYRSLGASGAVSAVIFAGLIIEPRVGIGILFIPIPIKGYIFGPLYLIISSYLSRQGRGNINHSAHIWGAIFGVVFIIVAASLFTNYPLLEMFVRKIRSDIGY
jgi:membrane associated rhomboid family serine protease